MCRGCGPPPPATGPAALVTAGPPDVPGSAPPVTRPASGRPGRPLWPEVACSPAPDPVRPTFWLLTLLALAASARAQPGGGPTLRGTVVDRDTRAPLVGAVVVVVGTDPLRGAVADADGRFAVAGVPLGRHTVRVTFVGYAAAERPGVLVTAAGDAALDVALEPDAVVGGEVVVRASFDKDRPLNDFAAVSARSFSVEDTRRYAGGLDDPARMASAFAGVTTGSLADNALAIRGNAPKGVLWRVEGVEVPNPNHFAGLNVAGGGALTFFSSRTLADSDFLTGAFPAEYGNALSGVFDVALRSGNPDRREHAVQLGVVGVDLATEGPLGRGASYLVNYRYSTLALLRPLLPTDQQIAYQDLTFKLAVPTRRAGRFEAWGLGGLDRQTAPENPDSTGWRYPDDRVASELTLGAGAAGLTHVALLGPRRFARTTAAVSRSRTDLFDRRYDDRLALRDDLDYRDVEDRLVLSSVLNTRLSPAHMNRTGASVQRLSSDVLVRAAPGAGLPLATVADRRLATALVEGHTQSAVDLSARVRVHAGVHVLYASRSRDVFVEPRLAARWSPTDRDALSVGYGLHSQAEPLRLYAARLPDGTEPNRTLGLARAHHLVGGYDRRLGDAGRLKAEVYVQRLFSVPVVAGGSFSLLNFEQDLAFAEPLVNRGAGLNVGLEFTAERFLRGGVYGLLTGTVFRSRYRGGDGVWRDTRFARGFAVNALAGREFSVGRRGSLVGVNGRLTLAGGARYSPADLAASQALGEVVEDGRLAFTRQAPTAASFDLTATYRRNHRRVSEVWALQVKNVLGARDFGLDYNLRTRTVDEVRQTVVLPLASYTVTF